MSNSFSLLSSLPVISKTQGAGISSCTSRRRISLFVTCRDKFKKGCWEKLFKNVLLETTWVYHSVVMLAAHVVLSCNGAKTTFFCVWPGELNQCCKKGLVGHL